MSCNCNYSVNNGNGVIQCRSCNNSSSTVADSATITQKRIWKQVRVPASMYSMNLSSLTSSFNRLASGNNTNWNQMSDRTLASQQTIVHPTRGNSLRSTLTSNRPGASTLGGSGVDVKHDSYARYLNRKKAGNLKTQTSSIASVPLQGNKTQSFGLLANSGSCCSE